MNDGRLLVCYLGNGETISWSSPPIFGAWDVPSLTNLGNYSVVLSAHNLSGFFMDAHSDSLTESMLIYPGGGSVAAAAPAVKSPFFEEYYYLDAFFMRRFGWGWRRLGDIDFAAKEDLRALGINYDRYVIIRSYFLLGDPALEMK
jgi:hypothetical protein